MLRIEGQPILTAAQMRAAEERAAPTPDAMYALMERAGAGVADAVRRLAAGAEVLVLCGPGNNGGDGYVTARVLREWGVPVRVAALTPPRTSLARRAASSWTGPVACCTTGDQLSIDAPAWGGKGRAPAIAPVLVDAMFGTGGRENYAREPWLQHLRPLFDGAQRIVAVDLPLGLSPTDFHHPRIDIPAAHLTLAIGALKPLHVLPWAKAACGDIRLIDIGLDLTEMPVRVIAPPPSRAPDADSHKYTRGMVGVIAGPMPGAAALAAVAAARAGAGYVALYGGMGHGPAALVHRSLTKEALSDPRLDVVIVGPGLGRDEDARRWLEWLVTETTLVLVLDGDALHLVEPDWLHGRGSQVVLTPHAGELNVLTARSSKRAIDKSDPFGSVMTQAKSLALGAHVLVSKGATTVVADYGRAVVSPGGNPWLSTAGTGDVLAGAIGAMAASVRHRSWSVFDAAAAGVWLHAEAARRCGASFIADDLAHALTAARASLCR